MPTSENGSSQILLTHSVLTGLTPLIPVPLVDDLIFKYFQRSLVKKLAENRGKEVSSEEIEVLVSQQGRGFLLNFIINVLLYPLKKILRKVFFFLEWKRAADTISRTYYVGYLLDAALAEGWLGGEKSDAARVRSALDNVLEHANTGLVTRAALGVITQSKGLILGLVQVLLRSFPGGKPSGSDVGAVMDSVEEGEKDKLGGLVDKFQKAISSLPAQHLDQLRQDFIRELESPSSISANLKTSLIKDL